MLPVGKVTNVFELSVPINVESLTLSRSESDSCSMIMDDPGSATTTASSVVILVKLISSCCISCITTSIIPDGSTASEKFSNNEPTLRSSTTEYNTG